VHFALETIDRNIGRKPPKNVPSISIGAYVVGTRVSFVAKRGEKSVQQVVGCLLGPLLWVCFQEAPSYVYPDLVPPDEPPRPYLSPYIAL
jgi:hypothetical protein